MKEDKGCMPDIYHPTWHVDFRVQKTNIDWSCWNDEPLITHLSVWKCGGFEDECSKHSRKWHCHLFQITGFTGIIISELQ
jgi:hypothetical protein